MTDTAKPKLCQWCRSKLPADKPKAKYCSARCRQRASRHRRSIAEPVDHPWLHSGLTDAERCTAFIESLTIPEGPKAGQPLGLAPFQREFVQGALAPDTVAAVLSIARGNDKTMLAAAIAVAALLGVWDPQPRRDVVIAARMRDQAAIAWNLAAALCESLPLELRALIKLRRAPRLEIEFTDENGTHVLRAIAANGKSVLGASPTFILMDERAFWPGGRREELEHFAIARNR